MPTLGLLAISSALAVAVEAAEDAARHAAQLGHRRVVGVDADAHAGFLGHRRDLLDEVGEVVPDLVLGCSGGRG